MITVNREKIREAFRLVNLVPESEGVQSSQMVRLKATAGRLRLNLTGGMIGSASIAYKEKEEWVFYVKRKVLSSYLGAISSSAVELSVAGEVLSLRCGRSRLSVTNKEKVSGYGDWKDKEAVSIGEEWMDVISLLSKYTSHEPGMLSMETVRAVADFGLMASDTIALASFEFDNASSFHVPTRLAGIAKNLDGCTLYAGKDGAALKHKSGYLYQPNRDESSKFPDKRLKKLIGELPEKQLFTVQPELFRKGLKQIMAFGGDEEVQCKAGKEKLVLSTKGSTLAANVTVPAEVKGEFSMHYSTKALSPWVDFAAENSNGIEGSLGENRETILRASTKVGKVKAKATLVVVDMRED